MEEKILESTNAEQIEQAAPEAAPATAEQAAAAEQTATTEQQAENTAPFSVADVQPAAGSAPAPANLESASAHQQSEVAHPEEAGKGTVSAAAEPAVSSPAASSSNQSPAAAVVPAGSASAVIPPATMQSLLQRAKEVLQLRKRKKLEKILALAKTKGKIANDDVQKLLRVSDATATRYLAQLVQEGKLRRVGPPKGARYEPA